MVGRIMRGRKTKKLKLITKPPLLLFNRYYYYFIRSIKKMLGKK